MQENILTTDQMAAVLDCIPAAIYISRFRDCELLYANHLARKLFFQNSKISGGTCYGAAGFDKPCPFCKMDRLGRQEAFVREFRHPDNGRCYQFSGWIIDWDGEPAHMEYILDITEKKEEQERSRALEQELQAAIGNIPCGLCVYRYADNKISPVFHNSAFYEITGYSNEDIRAVEKETDFLGVYSEDLSLLRDKVRNAIRSEGVLQHTYRLWNEKRGEYRWIRLDGAVKTGEDGTKLLYALYSDVSDQRRMEQELTAANEKMQDIINAIPGGVAIYRVSDIFETVYFSDGVPELTGYTVEEYKGLSKYDAANMIYLEDQDMVISRTMEVIRTGRAANFEFRKQHRDGSLVWVRAHMTLLGEDNGYPLLHCVFHNISEFKEAQLEMNHLINSIPGGIASYRVEGGRFIPTFFSDGIMALSGHSREEYRELVRFDALDAVYEKDRDRVLAAARDAFLSGDVLDVSYRMRHKDGGLIWIHLNGRRMGPLAEPGRFYAVFTGMSAETRLYQGIANETADGIYVFGKETCDLLYVNESTEVFAVGQDCIGQKCYTALHGKDAPCEFCTLGAYKMDGKEHVMSIPGSGKYYNTRFRETDWNGIPAYVKFVRDITEEVVTRKEKQRLEQYFQTVLRNLPGGIAVVCVEENGNMVPEFLSDGFASMTGMTVQEAWDLYRKDATTGVHPDDRDYVKRCIEGYIASGAGSFEIVYRLQKGEQDYIWVKNSISMIQNEGGEVRFYAVYQDVTGERAEQERIRRQYKDLIMQHYHVQNLNTLVLGHCNITQNRILEIIDYTDSDLLKRFGTVRESFFTGLSDLIVEEEERAEFLSRYLNTPTLKAFSRGETEVEGNFFVKFPKEELGQYVRIKINMVATPDSNDVTGILSVTDITDQTISDRILNQLCTAGYDFVADVNLKKDTFKFLSLAGEAGQTMGRSGSHSGRVIHMFNGSVVPRDKERYLEALDRNHMAWLLENSGSYTFAFSMADDSGDIRTKNLTITAVDLRIGRVCISRADITDSVREQQGLLRVTAHTFELVCFINTAGEGSVTIYTRETVLENLSPYYVEDYDEAMRRFVSRCDGEDSGVRDHSCFRLEALIKGLEEKPGGYDFLFPYKDQEGERYKQVTVMWGDVNHRTICLVRADVTDMLAAERQTKKTLEDALELAKEANRAKSDFLSAMSHDIRTPMNAIMGMTTLAAANLDNRSRVADYLQKISVSSRHLLSLINDILDMSKIERSQITLNCMKITLSDLLNRMSAIMTPQSRAAGLTFEIRTEEVCHSYFYGDILRISQILINILSNAVKYTPEGGRVDFLVEEIEPEIPVGRSRYRFTISDTGIGMSDAFLAHIFEPFTRSMNTTRVEGTGLGLSITKGLVDLMGGTITAESHIRQGSRFVVELEFKYAEAGDEAGGQFSGTGAKGDFQGVSFSGRLFLAAEDNAINAEILCELLSMYGAGTVVKADGMQAVQAFIDAAPGTYDAVLMDIQMPGMNGYDAARAIRELDRPDAKTIPIVAMTANAFAEDVAAALEAGMNAHVAKPIDMEVLRDTLGKVLGGGAAGKERF